MNRPEINLKYQHRFTDYIYWNLVAVVPVVTASIAIYKNFPTWLPIYIALSIVLVTSIMKFYCSHCPYYINGTRVIKCMFFWGVPKLFQGKPGALHASEKAITITVSVIIVLLPLYWLIKLPEFLIIYVLSMIVLATTIKRYECCRCIYVDCLSNSVEKQGSEIAANREG